MEANFLTNENITSIYLKGRFDSNAIRAFRECVDKALLEPTNEICVDLSAVEYLDSSALGGLLLLKEKAAEKEKKVVLRNPSANVSPVLKLARFERLFEFR